MARPHTVTRVHAAVLALAERGGPHALTMEGIAAEAGVGKQTLYRSWPSVHAILFDALADAPSRDAARDDGTLVGLLWASILEISTEPRCSLLRALAASIQTDDAVAEQFHERLLRPQMALIHQRVAARGVVDARRVTEVLLSPIVYRWLLRLPQFTDHELRLHVDHVLAADGEMTSPSAAGAN